LRAAAEATRIRILYVLSHGEFNVSELTQILGQSQPRVSRHLKLLCEAGLLDRFRWRYFHLLQRGQRAHRCERRDHATGNRPRDGRCGHHAAKEVVVLGDGAAWIWLLAYQQFPGALQIVDFYHVCEHLAEVGEARFGPATPESKAWQSARQTQLKTNRVDLVLSEILAWKPKTSQNRQIRRQAYHYFHTNAERMRYQTFLEKGYHIGSGVVEATCKHVVASRLDQAGMHWREASAEAILTLRAAMRSSEPPDLRAHCAIYV
jgi:DNA-binding transcriptional ArsR family regulator